MTDPKKSLELKKHVATIHSSNKLSLLQRKIANALLFNAYDQLLEKDEHEIHIRTLCKLIGYDSNDHKTIKKSLVNLLSTVIEWNLMDGAKVDTGGVWSASSIISDASIDGAVCTYSYSNKMKKLLHHPELYGRLNMAVQAKFQSSYGLALYENCIRYQNIGQTPWIDIESFRKLMGIEPDKYKIFRDFKSRVLDKAIEEVNKYSPIQVEPQLRKQNRQVVSIQFLIHKSDTLSLAVSDTTEDLSVTLKEKFGFSKKQIQEVMTMYEKEYILQKIALIESSPSFVNGKIANLAKYLLSALVDDYQAIKTVKDESKKRVNWSEIEKNKKAEQQKKDKYEKYRRFCNKQIIYEFGNLSSKERNTLLTNFERLIETSSYANIYRRDGLNDVLIQDRLCVFLREKQHEIIKRLISFEVYLANEVVECES